MHFFCYRNENIRYTKSPILTSSAKKITLVRHACLCLFKSVKKLKSFIRIVFSVFLLTLRKRIDFQQSPFWSNRIAQNLFGKYFFLYRSNNKRMRVCVRVWRIKLCPTLIWNFLSVKATCNTQNPPFRFGKFQSTSAPPLSGTKFHQTPSFST